jgi:hypothetical protein
MEGMNMSPGGIQDISENEGAAAQMRDMQHQINEATFSRVSGMYEEATRIVNYLEGALDAARKREQILGGAMDRLNAPQSAAPSIR